eukprot:145401-Rhodomonas_salina.1
MSPNGVFYPSVSFISTISPPNINVAFAKFGTGPLHTRRAPSQLWLSLSAFSVFRLALRSAATKQAVSLCAVWGLRSFVGEGAAASVIGRG